MTKQILKFIELTARDTSRKYDRIHLNKRRAYEYKLRVS